MFEELKNANQIHEEAFKEQFINYYKKDIETIRKNISLYTDYFDIEEYSISFNDAKEKIKNNDYLKDLGYEFTETGIKVLISIKEFWDDIKDYIPRSITKLNLSFDIIKDDIEYLKEFPNLHILVINDGAFIEKETIKKIYENTSIRNIYNELEYNFFMYNDIYQEDGFTISLEPFKSIFYKDLVISSNIDNYDKSTYNRLVIKSYNLENITNIYKLFNNKYFKSVDLDTQEGKYLIKFKDKKEIECISIKSDNINDANKFYNYMSNNGYNIENININLVNHDYYNIDLSIFEELSKKTTINFYYGFENNASYNEFMGLIESLKWYRKIINESNLSPVEKLMFAFDIMKTFSYRENKISKEDSRDPHRIIETGYIVCAGYSRILNQILDNIDDNIKSSSFITKSTSEKANRVLHKRNIVKIDDNKYNIHGIYALDVTWDSVNDSFKEMTEYNALDLYRYFLIPKKDYQEIFVKEKLPSLFKLDNIERDYQNLFNEFLPKEEIISYINVDRPSLGVFNEMLYNVRVAEGYSDIEARKEIERVNEVNRIIIDNMNNIGSNIRFFEKK